MCGVSIDAKCISNKLKFMFGYYEAYNRKYDYEKCGKNEFKTSSCVTIWTVDVFLYVIWCRTTLSTPGNSGTMASRFGEYSEDDGNWKWNDQGGLEGFFFLICVFLENCENRLKQKKTITFQKQNQLTILSFSCKKVERHTTNKSSQIKCNISTKLNAS